MPEVERISGLKRREIYHRMKDGTFPTSRKLGPKTVGWRHDEVMDWIDNLPQSGNRKGDRDH